MSDPWRGFLAVVALGSGQLSAGLAIAQNGTMQPSFDCAKVATPIERIICADPDLVQWDGRMGEAFKLVYTQLADAERRALLESQRRWIAMRNGRCNLPASMDAKPCILQLTSERLATLEGLNGAPVASVAGASVSGSHLKQAGPTPRSSQVPQGGAITSCDTYAANDSDPQRKGQGIQFEKIDPALAVPACESAVRKSPNTPRLNYQLGRAYHKANNFSAALEQELKAAGQGYGPAQNSLGVMYAAGQGVAKDDAQAVGWYRKAAEQGFAPAQNNLGFMYANGQGVPKDDAQAVAWYRMSAEQGFALAQNNLGVMYAKGQGLSQNYAEAVKWYHKSADQGNAFAQSNLGALYRNAQGVTQNYAVAMQWYRRAADQGNVPAQASLGDMYFNGQGVPQNYAEAAKWYLKAADQGDAAAQSNLGVIYQRGQWGAPQDYAEALKWYRRSADQGNAIAQDNLGVMYSEDHGVPQDFAEAERWFRKAADQGNSLAQDHLAAQHVRAAQEHGYRRITFDDFMLDGRELAANSAKVSVEGVYVKQGEIEMLFPSLLAIAIARETIRLDAGIGVLTNDATRSVRKFLLDCRNNPIGAQMGCSLTVIGRAGMCTRTTLVGSTDLPCLVVEDGAATPSH
jgi:TPR repeat protein/uncharacterized protein YecT (DUF1311 family)